MTFHREKARGAMEATVIHSATSYSWFGKRSDELPRSVLRALTPQTARSYLHYALQSQLYNDFYCAGGAQPWSRGHGSHVPAGRTPFVEALSEANFGTGYSTTGWSVTGIAKGMAMVRKSGVQLLARPADYGHSDNDVPPPAGSTLTVRFPKEFIHLSPGFYMAVGNRDLSTDGTGVVRWYWNLSAEGAIRFLRQATMDLNRLDLPFKLKVLSDPARYVRCDAAVLYVRQPDCNAVSEALRSVYIEVASSLKPSTPALTKQVAPGVGVAEDPGHGTSFGLHRCGVLAEGIIRAHENGRHALSDRLDAIDESFIVEGLSLDRPYLNPGSPDTYQLTDLAVPKTVRGPRPLLECADRTSFLETAESIGRRLTAEAIWHNDRCTWLGAEPAPESVNPAGVRTVFRTLGPDLYAGSSGLALFLAQLHAATGNPDHRKAALGAMAQSHANLDAVPPPVRLGLYAGWSGIALAAARTGTLLKAPEWIDKSLGLLDRLMREPRRQMEFDLLAGMAGGISALLVLWKELGEATLLDNAVILGEELMAAAEPADAGSCWRSAGHPDNPGLTGFSHGASGIGHALFELFGATGDARYQSRRRVRIRV